MLNHKEMNDTDAMVPVHHARGEQALFSYAFSEPVSVEKLEKTFGKAIIRSHCTAIPKKGFSDDVGIYKILMESSAVIAHIDGIVLGSIFTCGDTAKPAHGELYLREQLNPSIADVHVIKRGLDVDYKVQGFGYTLKGEPLPDHEVLANHMALHYGGIPLAILNNGPGICSYIETAYLAAGKQVLGQSVHKFKPHGITVISAFGSNRKTQGRFEIHTYPEHGQALIDIVNYHHDPTALVVMQDSLQKSFQPHAENTVTFSLRHPQYTIDDPYGMKSYAKRQEVV